MLSQTRRFTPKSISTASHKKIALAVAVSGVLAVPSVAMAVDTPEAQIKTTKRIVPLGSSGTTVTPPNTARPMPPSTPANLEADKVTQEALQAVDQGTGQFVTNDNYASVNSPTQINSPAQVVNQSVNQVANQGTTRVIRASQPAKVQPLNNQDVESGATVKRVDYSQNQKDMFLRANDVNQLPGVPSPSLQISDVSYIPTVRIAKTQYNTSDQLDISLLDDFIDEISPSARHYPTNFASRTERYRAKLKLKELEEWLRPFAERPDASYDVLLRATKLNSMGRNMDLGSDYAVRASTYVAKAIERQPNSAEANFLYGMMLSEGGGFKEGRKYLDRAVAQGYTEAEQSLAQTDLMTDNRGGAMARLQRLQMQNPNNNLIKRQLQIVQNGEYYIWDVPSEAYSENYPMTGQ